MAMQTNNEIRCSSAAVSYGKVLFGLNILEESVKKTREILEAVPQLSDLFMNPTVALKKKFAVIDRVFPEDMRNFLKTVCKYHRMDLIDEIFAAYDRCRDEENKVLKAVLTCTAPPDEEQKKGMESFLCRKYGAKEAQIEVRHDADLLGGFILRAGSDEYDWSMKGRLDRLTQTLGGRR